ncbi:BrnT family toxin [Tabrizicola sp. TH137]|uniref:BrnT family toxin n=1 Tax=Tabrizicola sp. TH137 TaxID=2067452 RepID=UPI000C79702A|nr:BrnT family toxin [Tabrizicola sp. TH137]PLL13758.1 BrnT family toxin [Tabrizicola sp. TH137]
MQFDWDEAKRQANITRHGIDLLLGALIFEGPTVEAEDLRQDYGERRFTAVGFADDLFLVVVYTRRGDRFRLISTRKGGRRDRRRYRIAITLGHSPPEG